MNSKLRGMLLGSFVADALALGPHWIYDVDVIDDTFGDLKGIVAPPKGSFHKGKVKGDFTHYGDQMMFVLDYMKDKHTFDIVSFKDAWLKCMETFEGYRDHATKDSIHHYASSDEIGGSTSDELGGVARMAPILYKYALTDKSLEEVAVLQTKLTHTGGDVLDMAKAIALLLEKVLKGQSPNEAIPEVGEQMGGQIKKYIDEAIAHEVVEPREMIATFGQSCSGKSAFPSVMYLLYKFSDSYDEALLENVSAGGDSAARAIVIGMVLGAHLGEEAIPKEWIDDTNKIKQVQDFM